MIAPYANSRHSSSSRSSGSVCSYCRYAGNTDYLPMHKYALMDWSGSIMGGLSGACSCGVPQEYDQVEVRTTARSLASQAVLRDLALAASAAVAAGVLVVALGLWG